MVNGIGVLIATGYSGLATSPERIPWAAYLSVVLYIVAFALPLFLEHRRLSAGFRTIEQTYRANRRRELDPPQQEVFAPSDSAHPAQHQSRRFPPAVPLTVLLTVVATLVFGFDVIEMIASQPQSIPSDGTISNY